MYHVIFIHSHPIIFPGAHFGVGNGTIWLSNIECVGHETDISLCGHNGWGLTNCGHDEDVALKCGKIFKSFLLRFEPLHTGKV